MSSMSMIGGAILVVLIAGYIARQYGLPPPPPKIAGIDLGTTFSSIAQNIKLATELQMFRPNGTVIVGTRAVEQQEKNPQRTIYDAKRFIGRTFEKNNENFLADQKRYPFTIKLDDTGHAFFEVPLDSGVKVLYPQDVGSIIISYLRKSAEKQLKTPLKQVVISVPAEFGENQRNVTGKAAELAGMEVRRVISEPTAASLAYGLHKKKGVESVVVLQKKFGKTISDKEDLQQIRLEIEKAKLRLTTHPTAKMEFNLKEIGNWHYQLRRDEFEELNADLFKSIEQPIEAALADANLQPSEVDEIVLVGGSTRIPKVRQIVGHYFGKAPNFGVDPELAVATGASVQAGVIGGGWPLQVAAMELPTKRRKRHFYTEEQKVNEKEMSVIKNVLRECDKKMWIDEHGEAIDSHQQGESSLFTFLGQFTPLTTAHNQIGLRLDEAGQRQERGPQSVLQTDPVEGTGTMSAVVWARSEEAFGSPDRNSDGLRSTR
ncbi:DnaK family protein [Teladorsagia circumcincta]|uniref:DnaK family protein n=1 Tax=Teladorsagia circumcincta TaxID=45464 RepID=A0A2G9UTU8_TELCI|nr:DnaK family protein [Teladorsagia circumcincta]